MPAPCSFASADWELYALGMLEAGEAAPMEAHLRQGCAACGANVQALEETVAALALAVPQRATPAVVRPAVVRLAQVAATDGGKKGSSPAVSSAVVTELPPRASGGAERGSGSAASRWGWVASGLAAAAGIAALWLGLDRANLQRESAALQQQLAQVKTQQPTQTTGSNGANEREQQVAELRAALVMAQQQLEAERKNQAASSGTQSQAAARIAELQQALDAARAEQATARQAAQQLEARLAEGSAQLRMAETQVRDLQAQSQALREQSLKEQQAAAARNPGSPANPARPVGEEGASVEPARLAALQRELDNARRQAEQQSRALADYRAMFRILESGSLRQVALRGIDPRAGKATATAVFAPDGGVLLLAKDLPRLPGDRVYQLWLVKKNQSNVSSAGLLRVDGQGRGVVYAGPQAGLGGVTALAISEEPAGGSPAPTGLKLLFGAV